MTSSAGFSVPCLSRLRLQLCPTASVRQGVVAEVLPLDPHKHSHIPAAQGGNVWSLQAEMGHFSTATADEAFTAVNYSACVFKDSVNNYSGVGFFQTYQWYFHQKTLFTEIDEGEKNIYSECASGKRHWLVFYGKRLRCSGTNRPGGPDLLLSLNWDRCRRNSLCLVCSGPADGEGIFPSSLLENSTLMPRATGA